MTTPTVYSYDFNITQGVDYPSVSQEAQWTFSNASNTYPPTFTAYNLTGYTAIMKVRSSLTPLGSVVLTVSTSTSPQMITLGGTAGTISITIPGATTLAIAPGVYFYDMLLIAGTGANIEFMSGKFIVSPLASQ
jgi:hypothetical protein